MLARVEGRRPEWQRPQCDTRQQALEVWPVASILLMLELCRKDHLRLIPRDKIYFVQVSQEERILFKKQVFC